MSTGSRPINRILVADDLARADKYRPTAALLLAADTAAALNAELHLIHAYNIPEFPVPSEAMSLVEIPYLDEMAQALEAEATIVRAEHPGLKIHTSVEKGPSVDVILRALTQQDCMLVVIGTHARRGLKRAVLGSVAEEVIRRSLVPALSISPHVELLPRYRPRKILVPLDLSEPSPQITKVALEMARAFDAEVELLTIIEEWIYPVVQSASLLAGGFVMPLEREVEELANTRDQQLREVLKPMIAAGVRANMRLIERAPAVGGAIVREASQCRADLIILGHQHVSRLKYALLGSVSRYVIREAHCPVLAVPPLSA